MYELIPGVDYIFNVQAANFNGDGALSVDVRLFSCTPPSQGQAPTRVTSSTSSITIEWQSPSSDGGCEIIGYAVYVDDGVFGSFMEVNEEDDPAVRNNPGLHEL